MKIMKKILLRSIALIALLALASLGAQAASYDAGIFSNLGDTYGTPQPAGNFLDSYHFTVDATSLQIVFKGTHSGMFQDDLLLSNITTGDQYQLATTFYEAISLDAGDYIFSISGYAMNTIDPTIGSDYDLTMSAVPLPAAAWMFVSALLGFVTYSRRHEL
jgi:hypothetical protein